MNNVKEALINNVKEIVFVSLVAVMILAMIIALCFIWKETKALKLKVTNLNIGLNQAGTINISNDEINQYEILNMMSNITQVKSFLNVRNDGGDSQKKSAKC